MTLQSRAMTPSPAVFEGTLDALYMEHVEPNLPTPEAVAYYHGLLVDYCLQEDPLFLLRRIGKMKPGQIYETTSGNRIKATDNAPAWWMHFLTFHNTAFSSAGFAKEVLNAPVSFIEVQKRFPNSINKAKWYVAHIFPVNNGDTRYQEWDRTKLASRFLKSIHPCNHFYVPNSKPQRYGEDKRVIDYFAGRYSVRYADVWPGFLQCVGQSGFEVGSAVRDFGDLCITLSKQSDLVAPSRAVKPPTVTYHRKRVSFLARHIEPLEPDQEFRMVTWDGVFQMSKAEFYRDFPGVVNGKNYPKKNGFYNSEKPMKAILRYRVLEVDASVAEDQAAVKL